MGKKKITCDLCGANYRTIFEDYRRQGHQCSVSVTKEGLHGCYGSLKFDGDVFVWNMDESHKYMPQDIWELFQKVDRDELVFCDDCVAELLENEDIKRTAQNRYF